MIAQPAAEDSPGGYRWWMVAMLWLVCFANYADRQAIFSIFPPLQQEFSLTRLQLGILGSAFMWVYALSGPLAGWLCDRFSRRRSNHRSAALLVCLHSGYWSCP